jgi:hypothetical protein
VTKYLVIYQPKGALRCETKYFGPFNNFGNAYNYLAQLPAAIDCECKFVQEIDAPIPLGGVPSGWSLVGELCPNAYENGVSAP